MSPQPIFLAHDADLRLPGDALRQTGTQLVYCYHGEVLRSTKNNEKTA